MSQNKYTNYEYDEDEIMIDFGGIFRTLISRLPVILLVGIVAAFLAFMWTKITITPMYTATTKMYVLAKSDSSANITYNDLQTGTQLIKDYMELVKSRPVLTKTIEILNLDMSTDELAGSITVSNPSDTRIIGISVTNADPKMAKEIADAVREAVGIQITDVTDADSVNTVEEANLPGSPSSPNVRKNTMLGAMAGMLLAIAIIVIRSITDDTIRTPDDVEKYLKLPVLTSVPKRGNGASAKSSKKKGRR